MEILWDRKPESQDEKAASRLAMEFMDAVAEWVRLSIKHRLVTASFTPQAVDNAFFTCEIRLNPHRGSYHLVVWRGIRTGDAVPILYGEIK